MEKWLVESVGMEAKHTQETGEETLRSIFGKDVGLNANFSASAFLVDARRGLHVVENEECGGWDVVTMGEEGFETLASSLTAEATIVFCGR